MAAKEKKSAIVKHLNKDNQQERSATESINLRRGRKTGSAMSESKSPTESKSPVTGRKKKKENSHDGPATPNTRKRRAATGVDEEHEAAKTPPPANVKSKKAFLEKELEDILENATGRNTPSTPRNRKLNEKEEENGEPDRLVRTRKGGGSDGSDAAEDKAGFFMSKMKKANENDDDNVSVRSFTTLLRTRKPLDKEVDDDVLSVRSMSLKPRRGEANNDDSSSVTSLPRSGLIKKVGRKKKSVGVVVKKKMFLKRGRPRKNQSNGKEKLTKKAPKKDELVEAKESKALLNKTLKYQNIGGQRRLRSAMLLKKQKMKKAGMSPDEKQKTNSRGLIIPVENWESDMADEQGKNEKERLRLDSYGLRSDYSKGESTEVISFISQDEPKKDGRGCKKKLLRKDRGKKGGGELYYYPDEEEEEEVAEETSTGGRGSGVKIRKTRMKLVKQLSNRSKSRKPVPGIHFESTSSPDDSSVIIVQPRIGPRIKYNRVKQMVLNDQDRRIKAEEVVPKNVLPMQTPVPNFNQIGSSYFVQSIPNFKLLATNSTIIRSYNANSAVNPNFDSTIPVSPNNLPFADEADRALAALGPKVTPNDVIVTPSGIILSSNRLNQHMTNICINGPNTFLGDPTNSNIIYSSQESVGNVSTTEVFYQNNSVQPQTCTKSTTAILLERPTSVSTSLISTTTGTFVINSRMNNGALKTSGFVASSQTDTGASEKALEGELQQGSEGTALEGNRGTSSVEPLPAIPVARNVNELLILKNKTSPESKPGDKTDERRGGKDCVGRHDAKRTKRTLRNVRQNHSSVSELTFSEPESSSCEVNDGARLYKTVSCERLDRSTAAGLRAEEAGNEKMVLQLGSEPVTLSESLAPFETASAFLHSKSDALDKKLKIDLDGSPAVKEAIEVCSFSKENAEALRELGIDSDADRTKSEVGSSPTKMDEDADVKCEMTEYTKKERIKEEVDNVLKEMPNRKIPNLLRKSDCFNVTKKLEMKNPLVLKNNDYLTRSPSKPPTVIDKLLERNKSLKKAEQESKYQNSVRNLSENMVVVEDEARGGGDYDKPDLRHKKSLREVRTRKHGKGSGGGGGGGGDDEQRRLVASKRFVGTNSGCKVYERRGSNPELYSSSYESADGITNENLLLRALMKVEGQDKYGRRGSIDLDIQKVVERRSSLPVAAAGDKPEKKTDNIKTILIGSSTPLSPSKSHSQGEGQTRVINIVTGHDGSKTGQNLMEEIGMEMNGGQVFMNGDKDGGRRTSMESSSSETESLKKLDGVIVSKRDGKSAKEVPYSGEKGYLRLEKIRLSLDRKCSEDKSERKSAIEESPEDLVTKETILSALGLQRAAAQNAQKKNTNSSCQTESASYTGTLKTVIKIHRQEKKGNSKAPMKMIYKASSSSSSVSGVAEEHNVNHDMDGGSKDEVEEETKNGNGKAKSLVIPEKASSFSIHPGRMCSDVCTYCFGKFGLLDTPCHIAQLKDAHKRRNILAAETHLLADSCLCDACFRHVDKKSNCPTFTEKKIDRRKFPGRKQVCCARNCNSDSQHNVRRKWFVKLKKSIGRKIVLDQGKLENLQPAHLVPLCQRHFYWIGYFMSCGICKKRLTSVNMHRVGPDVMELNAALSVDGIPTILTEKRFLCKLCHYYASIRIKCKNPNEMSNSQCQFYESCRKRILQCHAIEVPDSEGEPDRESNRSVRNVKRTRRSVKPTATVTNGASKSDNEVEVSVEELERKGGKDMKEVSHMNIPPKANGNLDFGGVSITPSTTEVNPTQIHVKLGNLNIGALGNLNIGQDVRHGTRSSDMQCFPTEAELALRAHFDLKPSAEDESAKSGRKGFEKCTTTIQFNPETKNLFYSLQMPYGNHSSFFRHLILLEKYFRNGDLVISRNADPKAVNYISSVQNRIRSYEGVHNPVKKTLDIPPSLSILPQPIKTEGRSLPDIQPSVIQSRPFTLTPMPASPTPAASTSSNFPKNSPLSHIQAAVQNIPSPGSQPQGQGFFGSLLKSMKPSKSSPHPKPEISITSVPPDPPASAAAPPPPPPPPPAQAPVRIGKNSSQAALTSKIQENLRNLAAKSQTTKQANQARAVILNRTVGGQKQSLVQVTTGGRTIHLTLYQFRRIQQMQMRKKQYLEHQAKMHQALMMKEETAAKRGKSASGGEEGFDLKNLSRELEIQEIKQSANEGEIFPLISEVRSLAGEEASSGGWGSGGSVCGDQSGGTDESLPKIPKALSVSITKAPPPPAEGVKEQSVEPVE